jgi:predicted transposase YdaD
MRESVTYQAILEEGRAEGRAEGEVEGRLTEARRILLGLGTKRFGAPSSEVRDAVQGVTSLERVEHLMERLLDVESWEELLAE